MSDLSTSWQKILHDAISQPGVIHDGLHHSYSVGNQNCWRYSSAQHALSVKTTCSFASDRRILSILSSLGIPTHRHPPCQSK